ncbi:MAG: dCTP deaminase [Candidatus Micrarchaeia archaeon]
MAILSDVDIKEAMKAGAIKFFPQISNDQIGAGSVDVTLSDEFWRIKVKKNRTFDLKIISFDDIFEKVEAKRITIQPGELVLAKTAERISLAPNICGWIQGRSRFARLGIAVHTASSFIQPGSSNRQILEIVNLSPNPMILHAGMRICQLVFEMTIKESSKPYSKFGNFSKQ